MDMLNYAFEDLAHALRRLAEAQVDFKRLAVIDLGEAVGNLESATTQILSSFHSLYDSTRQTAHWHKTPQAYTLLAIRNARHHNTANRIRSYASMARHGQIDRSQAYFISMYDEHLLTSWPHSVGDVQELLATPQDVSRISKSRAVSIGKYLNLDGIEKATKKMGINQQRTFFDLMPIITNAVRVALDDLSEHIVPMSDEGRVYIEHFAAMEAISMDNPIFHELPKTLGGAPI